MNYNNSKTFGEIAKLPPAPTVKSADLDINHPDISSAVLMASAIVRADPEFREKLLSKLRATLYPPVGATKRFAGVLYSEILRYHNGEVFDLGYGTTCAARFFIAHPAFLCLEACKDIVLAYREIDPKSGSALEIPLQPFIRPVIEPNVVAVVEAGCKVNVGYKQKDNAPEVIFARAMLAMDSKARESMLKFIVSNPRTEPNSATLVMGAIRPHLPSNAEIETVTETIIERLLEESFFQSFTVECGGKSYAGYYVHVK